MKKFLKVVAALAILATAFSCTKTKVVELTVSPMAVSFETAGGSNTVSVTCNDSWTVTSDADWITFSPDKGEGNGSIKITAPENKSLESRQATVTVSAGDVKRSVQVAQLGKTAALNVSPIVKELDHNGGTFDLTVTANIPWSLSIPADAKWITADKTSFEGSGVAKITVAVNESTDPRSAKLVVTGDPVLSSEVEITQAGEPKQLEVGPVKVDATYEGGSFQMEVTSNQSWTVSIPEDALWLKADVASGEKNGTVTLTVENNIYRKVRTADVVFAVPGADELTVTVPVSQEMAPASMQTDSLALVAIYNAAKGAEWADAFKWDLAKPVSEWRNVTLTNGRVSKLQVVKNASVPEEWILPEEVTWLTELVDLRINTAKLKGDFPEFLYDMTQLTQLWLTGNNLTGSLSSKLGQLVNLTHLYVDQNADLAGELPKEIGQLTKLQNINISQTKIGGTIPAELSNCKDLANFMAFKTQLATPIPDIWDKFSKIAVIQLFGNPNMEGDFPDVFAKVNISKNLSLWLYDCNFTGNIPESYGSASTYLNQFRINGNKMTGEVPAAVRAHAKWPTWNAIKYILPQQDGCGLTIPLDGTWKAPRSAEQPNDIALVLNFSGNNLTLYIIAWGMRFEGTYSYANNAVTYTITKGYKALTDVSYDGEGKMTGYSWMAGNLDPDTLQLTEGYSWYDATDATNPFNEIYLEYKVSLASFEFKLTAEDKATSTSIVIPDVVLTKVK